MRQHRVLVIRNAFQQDTGGAEQYAFNLAKALKAAGHVPYVVTKHKLIHDKCRAAGIASIQGRWHESQEWSKRYYLRYVLMTLWYSWLIVRHRISVVHPQGRDDFIFATDAGWWLGKRVVWTDHADLKYIMDRQQHRHPRMQAWLLRAARRTSKIICVSWSERKLIEAVAPELKDKLIVVHNGVFPPQDVHPVDKPTGKVVIGTNARLVKAKGINELLAAGAALAPTHPNIQIWLLGGYSNNNELFAAKAAELGLTEDQVRFIGYVANPDDYVASMDVFVHASYHEAFSLAIVEACMLGRPVIATKVGGSPEIIDHDTGLLVPPQDVDALAAAIRKLLDDDKLRTALGAAASRKAHDHFNFQTIVETKVLPLYERSHS